MREVLTLLYENPHYLPVIAGVIAYGVVEVVKHIKGLPLTDAQRTATWWRAIILAGLLHVVPLAYAALETGAPVPWAQLIVGTLLAMGAAVGAYEGQKNVARALKDGSGM